MAMISFPRQRELAMRLSESLKRAGIHDRNARVAFTIACFQGFTQLPDESWPPPPEFFDLERTARIHARREGMSQNDALDHILKRPAEAFELVIEDVKWVNCNEPRIKGKNRAFAGPALHGQTTKDGRADQRFARTLSVKEILESAQLTLELDGKRPTKNSGKVKYGPLTGDDWRNIQMALYYGQRGLKDCGYKTLPQLLDAHEMPRIKGEPFSPHGHNVRSANFKLMAA